MDLFYQEADIEDSIFETTIDMYIESAISIIESMENVALIRASYFTEASKDNEKEVSDKMDGSIVKNIQESIDKIFGYTVQDIQGGPISKKLIEQASTIKEIGNAIKASDRNGVDISKVKVSCPNIWKYYEFIEELVEDHIEKFTVDKSLNLFNRVTGTGKSIDVLIKNLNDMCGELRKSKVDAVKGMNKRANKIMKKNTIGSIANRIDRAFSTTVGVTTLPDDVAEESTYTENFDTTYKVIGIVDDVILSIALAGLTVSGLAAVHRFFKSCPTTIKMEKTTVGEVYTRLKALAPDKFLVHIAKVSKEAADAVGSKASIMGFSVSPDGPRGAVIYAGKINKLIKAYSKFYVALVDFYIKALRPVLR